MEDSTAASIPTPNIQASILIQQNQHKKWTWWVATLTVLALVSLGIAFAGLFYLQSLAKSGVSGTEFMALLLIPFVMASFPLSLIAFILGLIHLIKHSLSGRSKKITVTCLILSGAILIYGVIGIISNSLAIKHAKQQEAVSIQQLKTQQKSYEPKEVSEASAISMISSCQIHQFYYGAQQAVQGEVNAAAKTTSGVVLVSIDSQPWRLTATEVEGSKLMPSVNAAVKKCGYPFINSDN